MASSVMAWRASKITIICSLKTGTDGILTHLPTISVTRKKSPNVYKSCLKMISQEKLKIITSLQKMSKNVGDLGKLIVAKGFKKLPKVQ